MKNTIEITDSAWNHFKKMSSSMNANSFRVGLKSGGCSGFSYDITIDNTPEKLDEVIIKDDVTVIVDASSLMYLIGTTLDYKEDFLESKFEFKNPNAVSSCGCQKSIGF